MINEQLPANFPQLTDFDQMKALLTKMGCPFTLTDDSKESQLEEPLDTVIVLTETPPTMFMFKRDGSFKEFCNFGE